MPDWLQALKRRGGRDPEKPAIDLLVVSGQDAGQQFTVDADSVEIARGRPRSGQPGAILLRDPTVSSRQAVIHVEGPDVILEHRSSATNPTLVNGEPITRTTIGPGDRIQMGRVILEVRAREGLALSSLGGSLEEEIVTDTAPARPMVGDVTEQRPAVLPGHYLILIRGGVDAPGARYAVSPPRATIGRDPTAEVMIDVRAVSRRHAELVWDEGVVSLVHLSEVNQTFVNGLSVRGRHPLSHGDEIRLADQVVLRLEHERPAGVVEDVQRTSLKLRMEEKIQRDLEIEEKYAVKGSFLDVDVVGSYRMKESSRRPEHIIVSFERWRAWLGAIVEEFEGLVLNSNGDELMCFFESTLHAVRSASAILVRLDAFNDEQNVLNSPFRLRIGVHTGSSLVDRKRGVAYSAVLDVAGHLQKAALENGLLVSEDTMQALPDDLPFEPAGVLEPEQIQTYRMMEPIS